MEPVVVVDAFSIADIGSDDVLGQSFDEPCTQQTDGFGIVGLRPGTSKIVHAQGVYILDDSVLRDELENYVPPNAPIRGVFPRRSTNRLQSL